MIWLARRHVCAYHHVLPEQTLLLLQTLFHTCWWQTALSYWGRVLAAVNVTIDIDLELDEGVQERLQDTPSSNIVNIGSLGRCGPEAVVQVP